MRTLVLATLTMVTAFGASAADAQGSGGRLGRNGSYPGASYPVPGSVPVLQQRGVGGPVNLPPPPLVDTNLPRPFPGQVNPQRADPGQPYPGQPFPGPRTVRNGGGSRWGESFGGQWAGGMNAPGGWNAYRRPTRGDRLPNYWISPNFFINDFGGYGLYAPPQGHGWQRYYDVAVLVDPRGLVQDSVFGLDWDGGYGGYGDSGFSQGGYSSVDYGYSQGGGYSQGVEQGYAYPPHYQTLPPIVQNGGVTTYSTASGYGAGGYASGGYYAPGATTTVVTIMGAPTITTTTTEYIEEVTRTRHVAPRRVHRAKRRVHRPARCGCRCVCAVERPILGS